MSDSPATGTRTGVPDPLGRLVDPCRRREPDIRPTLPELVAWFAARESTAVAS